MITTVDLSGEFTSKSFSDPITAIANCPAKTAICGNKEVVVTDSSVEAKDLGTTGLNNSVDSCHWIVVATCDVPEIEIHDEFT